MKTYILQNDLVNEITINIKANSIHEMYKLLICTFSSAYGWTLINPD